MLLDQAAVLDANLEIINALGQAVYSEQVNLAKGNNQYLVRMNDLKAGYYIVRIKSNTAQWVKSILRK